MIPHKYAAALVHSMDTFLQLCCKHACSTEHCKYTVIVKPAIKAVRNCNRVMMVLAGCVAIGEGTGRSKQNKGCIYLAQTGKH